MKVISNNVLRRPKKFEATDPIPIRSRKNFRCADPWSGKHFLTVSRIFCHKQTNIKKTFIFKTIKNDITVVKFLIFIGFSIYIFR